MIPPSARRTVTNSVSSLTSFGKASLSFSGKALWVISTSAFLIGVPWALAYAEEEQYIQMEREQGMIKGANEVCSDLSVVVLVVCSSLYACQSQLHAFVSILASGGVAASASWKFLMARLQRGQHLGPAPWVTRHNSLELGLTLEYLQMLAPGGEPQKQEAQPTL